MSRRASRSVSRSERRESGGHASPDDAGRDRQGDDAVAPHAARARRGRRRRTPRLRPPSSGRATSRCASAATSRSRRSTARTAARARPGALRRRGAAATSAPRPRRRARSRGWSRIGRSAPRADPTRVTAPPGARRGSAAAMAPRPPAVAPAPPSRTSGQLSPASADENGPASATSSTRPAIQVRFGASPPGSARARASMRPDWSTAVIARHLRRETPGQLSRPAAEIEDVRAGATGQLDEQRIERRRDTAAAHA